MSVWTRIAEILSDVGDSIAAALHKLVGAGNTAPENSLAFTIGMIALGAKMAKADGVVTGSEVKAFRQIFHVPPHELLHVARVFDLAKQDVAGFESYARQISKLFRERPTMLEDILDGLFHIAKADDLLHDAEIAYLNRVSDIFGFDEPTFRRIKARHAAGSFDAFEVLGLNPTAGDDEIRTRYRMLVRENHPDMHIAAGMPPELIDIATAKIAAINAAYETIAKERGL